LYISEGLPLLFEADQTICLRAGLVHLTAAVVGPPNTCLVCVCRRGSGSSVKHGRFGRLHRCSQRGRCACGSTAEVSSCLSVAVLKQLTTNLFLHRQTTTPSHSAALIWHTGPTGPEPLTSHDHLLIRRHGVGVVLRQEQDVLDTWFSSGLWYVSHCRSTLPYPVCLTADSRRAGNEPSHCPGRIPPHTLAWVLAIWCIAAGPMRSRHLTVVHSIARPFSTLGWPDEGGADLQRFFPTQVRIGLEPAT
jgi:hypothetical protein